ncbi:MAG: hypothetical protein QM572_13020 [Nocardioides sp.]|uniref:hypothetical protein n=1 Tax=Nocardioides sp. TaxID=35761 RepID=UPI0039E3688D
MTRTTTTRSSRRRQRAIALAAFLGFGTVLWIGPANPVSGSAGAAKPATSFRCGPNDDHRTALPLSTGRGTATSGTTVTPCLSGVLSEFSVERGTGDADVATVTNITKVSNDPISITTADGSTISGLYHIAFSNFDVAPDEKTEIKSIKGTSSSVPYTFTLKPDGADAPVVGDGEDVVTDKVVTGDSVVTIDLSSIDLAGLDLPIGPIGAVACALVGGTPGGTLGMDCTVTFAQLRGDLVTLFNGAGVTKFDLKSVDLKFYYLVTHDADGGPAPGTALRFPDTTIAVTP